MKIDKIELRKIFLPYIKPFETSGWVEKGNSGIIVKIFSGGVAGYGEAPVGLEPWYNEETTESAWAVMRDVLVPLILNTDINSPKDIDKLFSPVRGNKIARAGIEFAVWDLWGRIHKKSLSKLLGGTRTKVEAGVSIGIQQDIDTLINTVENYLREGYRRIKIKIKPGWDVEAVKAIRSVWKDIPFQVDANSIYTLSDANHLAKLDEYNLLLIEQPLAHDDIFEHSKLQKIVQTPICLDESIISTEHARTAIEIGACKIINIKACRVGGLTAAKKIHDLSEENGVPVWCGGMLETGIGRAVNAALASLPNFTLPGDLSANERYFHRDIVLNPFTLNSDGTLTVPNSAGSGAEVDEKFLDEVTLQKLELSGRK